MTSTFLYGFNRSSPVNRALTTWQGAPVSLNRSRVADAHSDRITGFVARHGSSSGRSQTLHFVYSRSD